MAAKPCQNCGSEFKSKRSDALFCNAGCRSQYHQKQQESEAKQDLRKLREEIQILWADGKKIISHFQRLEREYGDWEDRLLAIEKMIETAEKNLGLTKQEIVQYDATMDAFN